MSGRMAWRARLPSLGRDLGQGIHELGKGSTEGDRDPTAAEPPGPDDGAR